MRKALFIITVLCFLAGCSGLGIKGTEPSSSGPLSPTPFLFSLNYSESLGSGESVQSESSPQFLSAAADLPLQTVLWGNMFDFWEESLPTIGEDWENYCLSPETLHLPAQETVAEVSNPPSPNDPLIEKKDSPVRKKLARAVTRVPKTELPSDRPAEKEPVEVMVGEEQMPGESLPEPPPAPIEPEAPLSLSPPQENPVEKPKPLPSQLLSVFPSLPNDQVGKFIDVFQTRGGGFFTNALGRSNAYTHMMKKIFREKNLPEELVYLALIESGYNPKAFSRSKASGIWQFIARTAKRYGLKVNKWVDERRDPEKSTYAAAEYLKSLYRMFNSWDLATASYNAGEGKVLKAMRKANSQDFWEISQSRYLKKETKEYVPMFLAAMTIANDPQGYGFQNVAYHPPLVYEKVLVPPATRLERIARAAETDLSEIQTLNPSLRRDQTPPDARHFEIKLPPGKKEVFEKNFKVSKQVKAKTHRVLRGETLSRIAKKYRIPLQALCAQNELSPHSSLKPGKVLLLPAI